MLDWFSAPGMRDQKQWVCECFAADPEMLFGECQARLQNAEASAREHITSILTSSESGCLAEIKTTVGEIASCFRKLSLSVGEARSLFRTAPDEGTLLQVARTLSDTERLKQRLEQHAVTLYRETETYRACEQKLLSVLPLLTAAADAACKSISGEKFAALLRRAECCLADCRQCIARPAEALSAVMQFTSQVLPHYRAELLSASDFQGHGSAGDISLLRRRAGEFSHAVDRFLAEFSMLDRPGESS